MRSRLGGGKNKKDVFMIGRQPQLKNEGNMSRNNSCIDFSKLSRIFAQVIVQIVQCTYKIELIKNKLYVSKK